MDLHCRKQWSANDSNHVKGNFYRNSVSSKWHLHSEWKEQTCSERGKRSSALILFHQHNWETLLISISASKSLKMLKHVSLSFIAFVLIIFVTVAQTACLGLGKDHCCGLLLKKSTVTYEAWNRVLFDVLIMSIWLAYIYIYIHIIRKEQKTCERSSLFWGTSCISACRDFSLCLL